MKVVHLITQDNGGAGRACVRLHKALLKEGVDSIILTQNKTTDLPSVKRVAQSKFQKAFSRIRPFLSQLPLILYPKRDKDIFSPNLPFFTPSNRLLLKQIEELSPDVVHLHWIEDGFFNIKDLESIQAPLLWSLHDDIALALLYSASDVFIMPSFVESFGQTALESLSCGTPVVAFDTSGLKDIITHKYNGYLAKCYEAQDLKNGIEWILSLNTQEYAALAHNAHKSAVALFGSSKIAHSYIDMYQHLAGGGAVDKLRYVIYISPTF
ncbi:glycosyltransferase, partial [Helicobacter typhlonius]